MKPNYFKIPIPHLIIEDFFTPRINKMILKEILKNKSNFKDASTGLGKTAHRTNTVAMYDDIYKKDRTRSVLLKNMKLKFTEDDFSILLTSMGYPFDSFGMTNRDETQVSRYGDKKNQRYGWHIDRFTLNPSRIITLVYYAFKKPQKFTGGEIELASNPIHKMEPLGKLDSKIYEVKNNMAVIFPATTLHRVHPTKSSNRFVHGRFSVNCWIGYN